MVGLVAIGIITATSFLQARTGKSLRFTARTLNAGQLQYPLEVAANSTVTIQIKDFAKAGTLCFAPVTTNSCLPSISFPSNSSSISVTAPSTPGAYRFHILSTPIDESDSIMAPITIT